MKLISLTKGKFAQVDDEDYEWLNQWKWAYANGYAIRGTNKKIDGKHKTYFMHREILLKHGFIGEGLETDHKNRNGLDNRKENIWFCDVRNNQLNRDSNYGDNNPLKGTTKNKKSKGIQAQICIKGKIIYLGIYKTVEEAHMAYLFAKEKYDLIEILDIGFGPNGRPI